MDKQYALLYRLFSVCQSALQKISLDNWLEPLDEIEDVVEKIEREQEADSKGKKRDGKEYKPDAPMMKKRSDEINE